MRLAVTSTIEVAIAAEKETKSSRKPRNETISVRDPGRVTSVDIPESVQKSHISERPKATGLIVVARAERRGRFGRNAAKPSFSEVLSPQTATGYRGSETGGLARLPGLPLGSGPLGQRNDAHASGGDPYADRFVVAIGGRMVDATIGTGNLHTRPTRREPNRRVGRVLSFAVRERYPPQ